MPFKLSLKIILVAFVCLLQSITLNAQQKNDLFAKYKSFTNTQSKLKPSKYFICNTSKRAIVFLQNNNQLKVERQLSDSIFIISIIDKELLVKNNLSLQPVNNYWKLAPNLLEKINSNIITDAFLISTTNDKAIINYFKEKKIAYTSTTVNNTYVIKLKNSASLNKILSLDFINFISGYNTAPKTELQINNLDLSANNIDLLHSQSPALNGEGLIVSIKENIPDTSDIDLAGRYIANPLASTEINPHSTIMATMVAGAGNSWYLGRGVANAANITSSNFSNLLPDANANYQQYNISVQNHSYGVGVENFYGTDAAAFDATALANDKLLLVFSAGNSGNLTATTGNYSGIPQVANLTGSFKMAKNIITVGAIDSFYAVAALSSKGPAYDGRIKPEMVAYGEDGSSGSAALVSGTAILLQQAYKNINGGVLPNSSLVKAVLLNSCDDVAAPGIDFTSGFGNLNAFKAVQEINAQEYFSGNVTNGTTQNFLINIPANISKAKFTLVWNDAPANANAFTALQNDLDLQLKENNTGQTWLPWVLNSAANKDSLILLPVRKRDSLNNIEQVSIDNPAAGNYTISVRGFNVPSGPQLFSIAYQFDSANSFLWHFPSTMDNVFPKQNNLIRWGDSFNNASGTIDYSIDNGNSWSNIASNVNLVTGYFFWSAPDTTALALLRMTIGSQHFISDTFTISAKLDFGVGLNCEDSVLLFWNKTKGVNNYQLFDLGNKYLQPIAIVADTQYIFNKNSLASLQFAVAPIVKGKIGVKSYTINYTTQGVDCYVSNLLADLVNDNNALLQLTIGTTYLVNKIVFEKEDAGVFIPLQVINNISGLSYATTDINLYKGLNIYRVAIYLSNGKVIYSENETVIYFADANILVYPNPVLQGNLINIELKELNNQVITLIDVMGRKVFQQKSNNTEFILPANFAKGVYILTIFDPQSHISKSFKVIIR
jgi:hypothetical protein